MCVCVCVSMCVGGQRHLMQLILGVKCVDSLVSVMQIADEETAPPVSTD